MLSLDNDSKVCYYNWFFPLSRVIKKLIKYIVRFLIACAKIGVQLMLYPNVDSKDCTLGVSVLF